MKTVIYLDELLLTNFLAAAALLLGAGLLCARQCSGLRLMAGSIHLLCCCSCSLRRAGPAQFCAAVCVVSAAEPAAVRSRTAARSAKRKSLYLSAAVPGPAAAVLRCSAYRAARRTVLLWPCRHPLLCRCAGAAFCDTGFSVQDPLTGQAVVLVYYPAVRSALPQELRTFLDRYFACGTAPPPELRVRLVPCTTIAGHCVLPAVPAKALRTSKGSAAGILAAFCRPETQQPWTALLGSELAVQLGIR